ncbi:beta-propeller fold lactonase family protein [Aquiflexum lacus]|uniref:beta-propeller fold lactonase family protein n=1 Tax=Aquiflexum lacus TaxID=2483805 RepID=UPI00189548FE|nr:beta-propeller fold lactonase family protein [Aquiflexum lacus]
MNETQRQKEIEMLFVGTYTERDSKGIYVFGFDRAKGKLTLAQTISDRASPTCLDILPEGGYYMFHIGRDQL